MSAELILVPYELGREGVGMGAGPLALASESGRRVALREPWTNEVAASFELNRHVAAAVYDATARGALPVVLTGACLTQQGVVAGLGTESLGLVWLDAHADFHTPDSTPTGFLDGQGLSAVVGDCWGSLCASVPGFAPLPATRVVLAGARDLEPSEEERLAASDIVTVAVERIGTLGEAVGELDAGRVSLHVDLDVLDPVAAGRANKYATTPGIGADELVDAVRAVAAQRPIAALTLSAYDPSYDGDGRVREAGLAVIEAVAGPG